ncbi:hypothetical protein PROFUN_09526 [Planoprotostelium fungivorum]|uniref:Uncharacterized protein n=1 Tax=Planoprotostelium fungivorum TaxID=1890364 RepID=A0A2P6MT04_9EUKA|nr:hypothetical protein PROFUN_09526 [Planoprotostelium fungivorum]
MTVSGCFEEPPPPVRVDPSLFSFYSLYSRRGVLRGSTGLSGSSSHSGGPGCRFSCGHVTLENLNQYQISNIFVVANIILLDVPTQLPNNSWRDLRADCKNNWVNKEEKMKQRHKMGYLLGLSGIGKSTMLSVIKEQLIIAASQDQKYAYDSSFLNSLKNAVEVYIDLSNGSGPNGDDMSIVFASRLFVSLSEGSSWGRRRTPIPASKFTPRVVWELLGKAIQATGRDGWTAVIIAVDESQWVTDSVRSLNSFAGSIFSLMTSDEVEVGRLGQSIAVQHKTYIIPVLAGTVNSSQMKQYNEISSFQTESIPLPLISPEDAITAAWRH